MNQLGICRFLDVFYIWCVFNSVKYLDCWRCNSVIHWTEGNVSRLLYMFPWFDELFSLITIFSLRCSDSTMSCWKPRIAKSANHRTTRFSHRLKWSHSYSVIMWYHTLIKLGFHYILICTVVIDCTLLQRVGFFQTEAWAESVSVPPWARGLSDGWWSMILMVLNRFPSDTVTASMCKHPLFPRLDTFTASTSF